MSVALISLCSFLSGVGSCAAFQAALKTGMPYATTIRAYIDHISHPELADSSRLSNCMPFGSLWAKRFLLHTHSRSRISWRHLWPPHVPFSRNLPTRHGLNPLPDRRRPPKRHHLRRPPHQRTHSPRLKPPAPRQQVQITPRATRRNQ
jgi:hypothetical protein